MERRIGGIKPPEQSKLIGYPDSTSISRKEKARLEAEYEQARESAIRDLRDKGMLSLEMVKVLLEGSKMLGATTPDPVADSAT